MSVQEVQRDERTVAVENAGYRWSYNVLAFGVLALVAHRAFLRHENSWDLIILVIVSGIVSTVYQGWRKTLTRSWIVMIIATIATAGLLAAVILTLLHTA